ncbi:MAG: hypothetical protein QOE87_1762, partial [Gaiellales bacterium]|nr:hypothetical protein [Gaiellales bacterium]
MRRLRSLIGGRRLALLVLATGALIAVCVASATGNTGSESVTSPSQTLNLPDSGLSTIVVNGSGFVAGAGIQIQEVNTGLSVGIADLTVDPSGTFSVSVDVSYDMRGLSPGSGPACDSTPTSTCQIQAVYTTGGTSIGASFPLSFSGHVALPPTAALDIQPDSGTAPLDVQVNSASTDDPDNPHGGGLTDWAFDFGDGTTASGTSTGYFHRYTAAGTYHVTLKVTNDQGLTDTTSHDVVVS